MFGKMKNSLAAAALAAVVLSWGAFANPPAGSPVAIHGQLRVDGNRIVDKHGSPIALRGMSFFWSTSNWGGSDFYTTGAVNTLVDDWKATVVRAAIEPDPSQRTDAHHTTVIDAAIAKGIYVIIDFHAHSYQLQSTAETFFDAMSTKYQNVPNVIYEIFNEPCPATATHTNGGGRCQGDNWSQHIKPYANAVVKKIRDNGCNNVIIIGTRDYSKRVDDVITDKITGSHATNLAYAIHFYTAEPGTQHQGALRGWADNALNADLALFASEFGISEANGDGRIDTAEANTWFNWLDGRQTGWANWSISKKGESASALTGGASNDGSNWSSNLTTSGRFIRNKLQYYSVRQPLTKRVVGEGQLTVFPDFSAPNYPANYGYQPGTPVRLTAAPAASGWTFVGFETGDLRGTGSNPATVNTDNKPRTVTAVYEKNGNLVRNGTFTVNLLNPTGSGSAWTISNTSAGSITPDNNRLNVSVTTPGTSIGDLKVSQNSISLVSDSNYVLTFKAGAERNRPINIKLANASGTQVYADTAISLASAITEYKIEFTMRRASTTAAILSFEMGGSNVAWHLDDVRLEIGGNGSPPSPVAVRPVGPQRAAWTAVRAQGGILLRGPADLGATAALYDTRGRVVRSVAAKDGATISGIPSGSYVLVVKNAGGSDVLRTRVTMAR